MLPVIHGSFHRCLGAPVGVWSGIGYNCKCVTTVPDRPPGESSLAAVSSCLRKEVTCSGMGIPQSLDMHDPPACGHALVSRQMPRDLSLAKIGAVLPAYLLEDGARM